MSVKTLEKYDIESIKILTQQLSKVFDIVRLVDPENTAVITFDENDKLVYQEYVCFLVWEKGIRCHNCVSMSAINDCCRKTKYEFIDEDIYYVVSKPCILVDNDGVEKEITIEIVSNVSDEMLFEAVGKTKFIEKITEANEKIYKDTLTGVYNRRFYDEGIYLHSGMNNAPHSIAFIMIDIKNFKLVNDHYGHDQGDWILKQVGETLNRWVRDYDAVIRLGGDEFLVVLKDCTLESARVRGKVLKEKLLEIEYDKAHHFKLVGNYGVAFSDEPPFDKEKASQLLKEADEKMYLDKRNS